MRLIAFAGPSVVGITNLQAHPFSFAPPIRRGDLDAASDWDVILIIDGEFGQSLSVSPKEILRAIQAGKTVIGAASMGALRASELDVYGMIGIGWIYKRFADSIVRREDEVALLYSPLGYRPLTVPMINVEYWMSLEKIKSHIPQDARQNILKRCRSIFFGDRTEAVIRSVFNDAIGPGGFDALVFELGGALPDIKELDAILALSFAENLCGTTESIRKM